MNCREWLFCNLMKQDSKHGANQEITTSWIDMIWAIWTMRNQVIFEGKVPSLELTLAKFFSMQEDSKNIRQWRRRNGQRIKETVHVQWISPCEPRVKINVDGAARGNLGKTAMGVICRNEGGRILGAIASYIGFTTSIVSEATTILEGLKTELQTH